MKNIWVIILFTIREALSRKVFITFAIVSTVILLIFGLIFIFVGASSFIPAKASNSAEQVMKIDQIAVIMQTGIVSMVFGIGLFLSIFSTANFIPNLIEKGGIDLFLSKPISRSQLLLGRYFGGIAIIFINIVYFVFVLWFMFGLKFGYWSPNLLIAIITITFTYAVLNSLMVLCGVLTRSSVLAMILTYLIYIILSPVLAGREGFYNMIQNDTIKTIIDAIYYIIPKVQELSFVTVKIILGNGIEDWQPVLTSLGFLIVALGLSLFFFNKKDF